MIAALEILKEKMLSRTMAFASINPTWPKRTSLGINLTGKLNSSFFPPKTLFRSKTCLSHQEKVLIETLENQLVNHSRLALCGYHGLWPRPSAIRP